jgi:hypothetical protein
LTESSLRQRSAAGVSELKLKPQCQTAEQKWEGKGREMDDEDAVGVGWVVLWGLVNELTARPGDAEEGGRRLADGAKNGGSTEGFEKLGASIAACHKAQTVVQRRAGNGARLLGKQSWAGRGRRQSIITRNKDEDKSGLLAERQGGEFVGSPGTPTDASCVEGWGGLAGWGHWAGLARPGWLDTAADADAMDGGWGGNV